ncbi:MAG: peptidylprolyl isomerase [Acidobacteriota bacterium]|nr:peptidylprolyl isomerase [Acidobacteriota bacterium]
MTLIRRIPLALGVVLPMVLPVALWCQGTPSQAVRFHTNLGDIDVNLTPDTTPLTVANFMNYVNRGSYNNSIFHRSVRGFIIQGGGYQLQNHAPVAIPQDPSVRNEYRVSNTRGTISMAKLGTDPNSATNQWFFNLADNSKNLDNQNGGFTVFGRVANAAGLAVMDKIAGVPVYNAGSPFDQLPLMNYNGTAQAQDQNFVLVTSITPVESGPSIGAGGVITASAFGGALSSTPGSFVEIYGSNLAGTTRQWGSSDFVNGAAPPILDNVSVSVNGQPAFVYFVSPGQVNVQIPANVPSGGPVPVVVTYKGQASAPVMLIINTVQPGLYAPAAFNLGGKQYLAAIHATTGTLVGNGKIPGYTTTPAAPGETLIVYGIGFGPLDPGGVAMAGHIVQGQAVLTALLQFKFGDSPGPIPYQGLNPGSVGLYQFNVTVPINAQDGDVPVTVVLNGSPISQMLFVPVQAP